jgi:hypothetical protein
LIDERFHRVAIGFASNLLSVMPKPWQEHIPYNGINPRVCDVEHFVDNSLAPLPVIINIGPEL